MNETQLSLHTAVPALVLTARESGGAGRPQPHIAGAAEHSSFRKVEQVRSLELLEALKGSLFGPRNAVLHLCVEP